MTNWKKKKQMRNGVKLISKRNKFKRRKKNTLNSLKTNMRKEPPSKTWQS